MVQHPCKTCLYFAAMTKRCQRFPPLVVREAGPFGETLTVWPKVEENDGCGEHELAIASRLR